MSKILKFDNSPATYLAICDRKNDEGDPVGAIVAAMQGLERHPDDPDLLEELAECYCDQELPGLALDVWYCLLAVCGEERRANVYNGLGRCYYALENDVAAEFCFGQQILLAKDVSAFMNDEAFLFYFGDGKERKGRDYYLVGDEEEERRYSEYMRRARMAAEKRDFDVAERILEKIPYESDEYPDALNMRAVCADAQGDPDRAEDLLAELLEDEPENLRGWLSLGDLRNMRGDYEGALDAYDRLLELRPFDPVFLTHAALAEFNAGEEAEAEKLLAEAAAISPHDSVCSYYLGAVRDYIANPTRKRAPFEQAGDVPLEERKRRGEILTGIAFLRNVQVTDYLRPDEDNVLRWGFRLGDGDLGFYLSAMLIADGGDAGRALLREQLLCSAVSVDVKCEILRMLCFAGNTERAAVTFGFVFRTVSFLPFEIEEKDAAVFSLAYAHCFGYLCYYLGEEEFAETLRKNAYDFYYRMGDRGLRKRVTDESALSAALQLHCAFPSLTTSVDETAKLYGAKKSRVEEYLKLWKED